MKNDWQRFFFFFEKWLTQFLSQNKWSYKLQEQSEIYNYHLFDVTCYWITQICLGSTTYYFSYDQV